MHDQECSDPVGTSTPPSTLSSTPQAAIDGQQFSLAELFFVITLLAIELGVYLHVSQLLAFIPAGGFLLVAVIRFADIHNFLLGSIVGYVLLLLVAWLYVLTCDVSFIAATCVLIFAPACGYLLGGLLAEIQYMDN